MAPRVQDRTGEGYKIEVPGTSDFVSTARAFVAAVARSVDLGEPVVEDLKLAVSEACTLCIAGRASESAEPLVVILETDPNGVTIRIADSVRRADGSPKESLGQDVIRALFPEARIRLDDGAEITFSSHGPE